MSFLTPLLAAYLVLTNLGYTACFDTDARHPAWVAYTLTPDHLRPHAPRLPLPFLPDPRCPAVTDLDAAYVRSGYDRGHLAPAADFNYDTNHLAQTYYFSNIAPQLPAVNRDSWLAAERTVRALCADTAQPVHVLTFPYGTTPARVGPVHVPAAFVKVAYGAFGVRVWFIPHDPAPHNQPVPLDRLLPAPTPTFTPAENPLPHPLPTPVFPTNRLPHRRFP